MGLEAQCDCRWDGGGGRVKVLLESQDLILRGDLRRTAPIAALTEVEVRGEALRLCIDGEPLVLELGAALAARWARKITTPPPSLAMKLGLGPTALALLLSPVTEPAVLQALEGHVTDDPRQAALALVEAREPEAVDQALQSLAALKRDLPLWVIHAKGAGAAFGGDAVRRQLRAQGWVDTKIAAVGGHCSATRFNRRALAPTD